MMTARSLMKRIPRLVVSLFSIGVVLLVISLFFPASWQLEENSSGSGTVYASEDVRQKDDGDHAQSNAVVKPKGMDAFRELVKKRPGGQSFRDALRKREIDVKASEDEVAVRQRQLLRLQSDVEENVQRLEALRVKLDEREKKLNEALDLRKAVLDKREKDLDERDAGAAGKVSEPEAERARKKNIEKAASDIKLAAPESAAQTLLALSPDVSAAILRELSSSAASKIITAMQDEIKTGTDSDELKKKYEEIWAIYVPPK